MKIFDIDIVEDGLSIMLYYITSYICVGVTTRSAPFLLNNRKLFSIFGRWNYVNVCLHVH